MIQQRIMTSPEPTTKGHSSQPLVDVSGNSSDDCVPSDCCCSVHDLKSAFVGHDSLLAYSLALEMNMKIWFLSQLIFAKYYWLIYEGYWYDFLIILHLRIFESNT